MTPEEKDLLLKDICARLPYGVKIQESTLWYEEGKETWRYRDIDLTINNINCIIIDFIKPYLFPLSSITEEQKNQLKAIWSADMDKAIDYAISGEDEFCDLCQLSASKKVIDWLNANHFDYRGLIPMGLANDATGLNIY